MLKAKNQVPVLVLKQQERTCVYCEGDHDCLITRSSVTSRGGGATGKWRDAVTPKRGWRCFGIEDLGAGNYQECNMCEREQVRYLHHMRHGNTEERQIELAVGCICAGYMDGFFDTKQDVDESIRSAKARQRDIENRDGRRQNFPNLSRPAWKISAKGNPYIKYKGFNIVITTGRGRFSALIDGTGIENWFDTEEGAKFAAFDYLFPPRYTL